ncbi:MAG TPA: winged helix-turn-helix transcriptional regulator [Desulfitobacterium dehalogenans]|uniref:Winged helix-turn-helix transcriptional regulator n=1 Tax=Desulfitobacterium dehalogenans TaxID=36854 RepID=A0A7C6Z525_9FIRM|nr:winged helix-turn-helix transcriptional regulator [Desulfitobacterium dehalogenans]
MENKYDYNSKVFKAFSDSNRLKILRTLQYGERCACEILEDLAISQSTLSHHMKILCDSGIVNYRRQGKWMFYSLSEGNCQAARSFLTEITSMKHLRDINEPRQIC